MPCQSANTHCMNVRVCNIQTGSCHAWLEHGGVPHDSTGKFIVQECAHGLIRIRRDEHRQRKGGAEKINVTLAFRAPPLSRKGPLEKTELASITTALGLEPSDVLGHSWCVNGPEWRGLLLKSSQHVLAVVPNQALLGDRDVGIIGPRVRNTDTEGSSTENISEENDHFDYEVRAFCPLDNPFEDPATGSLNAGLAQWLLAEGRIGQRNNAGIGEGAGEREGSYSYVVRQGSAVGRQGQIRVMVEDSSGSSDGREDGGGAPDVWIGGACTTCISGMASFDSSKL